VKEDHNGSTQTVAGASVVAGDNYNEYDTVSAKTDNLQRADQIKLVVNTDGSDEAPLSIAESSEQTLSNRFGLELT
jgi:hypothetical protein